MSVRTLSDHIPSNRIEDSSTEGPLGPTVITSPSHRFEDAPTEGPLEPTLMTSPVTPIFCYYLHFNQITELCNS